MLDKSLNKMFKGDIVRQYQRYFGVKRFLNRLYILCKSIFQNSVGGSPSNVLHLIPDIAISLKYNIR